MFSPVWILFADILFPSNGRMFSISYKDKEVFFRLEPFPVSWTKTISLQWLKYFLWLIHIHNPIIAKWTCSSEIKMVYRFQTKEKNLNHSLFNKTLRYGKKICYLFIVVQVWSNSQRLVVIGWVWYSSYNVCNIWATSPWIRRHQKYFLCFRIYPVVMRWYMSFWRESNRVF